MTHSLLVVIFNCLNTGDNIMGRQ